MRKIHPYTVADIAFRFLPIYFFGGAGRLLLKENFPFKFDFLFSAVVIFYALAQFLALKFTNHHTYTVLSSGIFFRTKRIVNERGVCCLTVKQNIFQEKFFCVSLCKKIRGERRAHRLLGYGRIKKPDNEWCVIYRAKMKNILLMTLTKSDSASGILFLSAFIKRTGQIFGEEYSEIIYSKFDISPFIAEYFGIEPMLALVALLLFIGFIIAAVRLASLYANFKLCIDGKRIMYQRGIISKTRVIFNESKLSNLTLRESLLMRLLGYSSVEFALSGETEIKNDKTLLLPYEKKHRCKELINSLIPKNTLKKTIRPPKKAVVSYLLMPIYCLAALSLSEVILLNITGLDKVITTVFTFFIILCVVWAVVRLKNFKYFRVEFYENAVVICRIRRFSLLTTVIKNEMINTVTIKRSIFQRIGGTFDLSMTVSTGKITLRHLPY